MASGPPSIRQAELGSLLANYFNLGMRGGALQSPNCENPPFHTGIISELCEASLFCFATGAVKKVQRRTVALVALHS